MSVKSLMNQTVSISAKASYDREGRATHGASTDSEARIVVRDRRRMDELGNVIVINAVAYVPGDTTVNTDDKVTYSGTDYKVVSVNNAIGELGNTHHIKLELQKWVSA